MNGLFNSLLNQRYLHITILPLLGRSLHNPQYALLTMMLLAFNVSRAQNPDLIDSLTQKLTNSKQDTTHVILLEELAWQLRISENKRAKKYAYEGLRIAKDIGFKRGAAKIHHALASLHFHQGNYHSAIDQNMKALSLRRQLGDKDAIASSLGNMGLVYKNQGNYTKALEYYFKSLKIKDEIGHKQGVAISFGNIGIIYRYLAMMATDSASQADYFNESLNYCSKALDLEKELGNKKGIADNYVRIAAVYNKQMNYPLALRNNKIALSIYREIEDRQRLAMTLGNMGISFEFQGQLQKALEYYEEALSIKKDIGHKIGIALTMGNIGSLYIRQEKFVEAERILLEALEIAEEIGYLVAIQNWHLKLSKLHANANRYKQAIVHFRIHATAKDSLFNEQKSKELGKLEATYEFNKAEEERRRLEIVALGLENEKINRRNKLQYSIIVIIIVMVFAFIFALGKFNIPFRLLEGITFLAFLLFFEFLLVLLDPYIDQYSSGEPAIKLGFNAVLATLIFPLHTFFESALKKRS